MHNNKKGVITIKKVLVVDDDKNICELLKLYLVKEGFNVVFAYDGSEAVTKAYKTVFRCPNNNVDCVRYN